MAKGEKFDFGAREKMDAAQAADARRAWSQEMEAAIAASYPGRRRRKPIPQLIGWLDHQGEHYGKLVTSYRVNGDRAADFSTEVSSQVFFGRAAAFARFQLAWWISRAIFSIFA